MTMVQSARPGIERPPTARPQFRTETPTMRRINAVVWWCIPIVGFLILWEIASRLNWFNSQLLPPPTIVFGAVAEYFISGEIWPHLLASLYRGVTGFAIAAIVCVPLGILIGWIKPADRLLSPLVEVFRQIPSLAIFPVFLVLLGLGFKAQVGMVVWASAWPILLTSISGTRGVDPRLVKAARTLGARPIDLFTKVALPAAVPTIATGLRLGGSYAFLVLVSAEMIGANSGIGFLVLNNQYMYRIPEMYASIVILAIIGLCVNYLLIAGERAVSSWRK